MHQLRTVGSQSTETGGKLDVNTMESWGGQFDEPMVEVLILEHPHSVASTVNEPVIPKSQGQPLSKMLVVDTLTRDCYQMMSLYHDT